MKTGAELMAENPYRPWPARITSIMELTATEKLFEFRLIDERIREAFHQQPGQFVELSIFGVGEAPISISSSPSKQGFIELCVRRAGKFTEELHKMQCGDVVGIRGPFGRPFPFEKMKGHDILLVAGGLGIAPRDLRKITFTTNAASSAKLPSSMARATRAKSCSATSSRCGATVTTSIFT